MNPYYSVIRIIKIIAAMVSLVIFVGIPAGYFARVYEYEAHELQAQATSGADNISELIYANPDLWRFEEHRLESLLGNIVLRNSSAGIRVVDAQGKVIAGIGGNPALPTFSRSAELIDGNQIVGRVEVKSSLRPLLIHTAFAAVIGALLAMVVYFVLKIIPLRALTRLVKSLDESQSSLRGEIQAKELALLKARDIDTAMRHQSLHDALTNLPNRILLHDRLQQAIWTGVREKKTLALIMMDLDQFKVINDTLGHQAGDMVLQQISSRLPRLLRDADTVARLGGDEFAVLLAPVTDQAGAVIVAKKIMETVSGPIKLGDQTLHLRASLGIALFPEHGDDVEKLLHCADVAMYSAKQAKQGFAIYDVTLDLQNAKKRFLQNDLPMAIEDNQLVLYYQPKVDLVSNRICGVEALVRWQHPKEGLIFPDDFIGIAEKTGLVNPLTRAVLKMALQQAIEWQKQGRALAIAVNISAINLQDPLFPQQVAEMIRKFAISPALLEMEVTETALMQDPLLAIETIKTLHAMGIVISIDDFGTGYSSMSYLKKLVVEKIKIDKSFVMDMIKNESDGIIVRSTIDLAHNLGLTVIAEGVETVEAYERLKLLGCDVAQGYYLSRPIPLTKMNEWLEQSEWGHKASIV